MDYDFMNEAKDAIRTSTKLICCGKKRQRKKTVIGIKSEGFKIN